MPPNLSMFLIVASASVLCSGFSPIIIDPSQVSHSPTRWTDKAALTEPENGSVILWRNPKLHFSAYLKGIQKSNWGLSEEETLNLLREAVEAWNVKGSALTLHFDGATEIEPTALDGKNTFFFDFEKNDSVIELKGRADPVFHAEKTSLVYDECDIRIMASYQPDPEDPDDNLLTFVRHEIGHCLGLAHSLLPNAIMNYNMADQGDSPPDEGLSQDEQLAILNLYPATDRKQRSHLSGRFVDESGKEIYGLRVILIDSISGELIADVYSGADHISETGVPMSYSSNSGFFSIYDIPAAEYELLALPSEELAWGGYIPHLKLLETYNSFQMTHLGTVKISGDNKIDLGKIQINQIPGSQDDPDAAMLFRIDEAVFSKKHSDWINLGLSRLEIGKTYKYRLSLVESVVHVDDKSQVEFTASALSVSNIRKVRDDRLEMEITIDDNAQLGKGYYLILRVGKSDIVWKSRLRVVAVGHEEFFYE